MKYHMGIWKEMSGYPTREDIIFELNSYLIRDSRPQGEFSLQTFNSFLPVGWENMEFEKIIKSLIEDGTFELQKKGQKGDLLFVGKKKQVFFVVFF
jgi:hypothetical protein